MPIRPIVAKLEKQVVRCNVSHAKGSIMYDDTLRSCERSRAAGAELMSNAGWEIGLLYLPASFVRKAYIVSLASTP